MPASYKDSTSAAWLSRVIGWVNGSGVAVPVDATNPLPTGGNVASGTADAGNPVKVGGRYDATLPTLADRQRGDLQLGPKGQVLTTLVEQATGLVINAATPTSDAVNPLSFFALLTRSIGHVYDGTTILRARGDTVAQSVLPGLSSTFWTYAAASGGILNTTTAVTVKAAAGASVRNYISSIEIEWETLGAATEFAIRDGAAGTVIYRTKLGTAAGRKTINFPVPLRGTANTLLEVVTLTASVTGAVYANLQGFTGA